MLEFLNSYADGIQTLLAILASIVGIIWFSLRRENFARADVDLTVDHVPLGDATHLIRVVIQIRNIGQVRLRVNELTVFLQQISPLCMIPKDGKEEPFEFERAKSSLEFNWPAFNEPKSFSFRVPLEFEPGESGPIPCDFRVPYVPNVYSAYVHIKNTSVNETLSMLFRWITRRNPQMGWTVSKIIKTTNQNEPTIASSTSEPAAS